MDRSFSMQLEQKIEGNSYFKKSIIMLNVETSLYTILSLPPSHSHKQTYSHLRIVPSHLSCILVCSVSDPDPIRIHPDPLHLAGSGSGSTLILASDPDPDPLRFLFPDPDPDPAKCSGSGWIRVEPKLCREKSKTATTSTNLPSRLHYFFNFFVWNRVNIHYLPT